MKCMYCGKELVDNGHNPEDFGLHTPYMDFSNKCTCNDCNNLITITNRLLKNVLDSNGDKNSMLNLESHITSLKNSYNTDNRELRVIIAGSRTFNNYNMLVEKTDTILSERNVDNLPIRIISGTAKGTDILGERYAKNKGYALTRKSADWGRLGKRAGYVRNVEMADFAMKDNNVPLLIAFWDGISKGTKHMIDIAESKGIETYINYF